MKRGGEGRKDARRWMVYKDKKRRSQSHPWEAQHTDIVGSIEWSVDEKEIEGVE